MNNAILSHVQCCVITAEAWLGTSAYFQLQRAWRATLGHCFTLQAFQGKRPLAAPPAQDRFAAPPMRGPSILSPACSLPCPSVQEPGSAQHNSGSSCFGLCNSRYNLTPAPRPSQAVCQAARRTPRQPPCRHGATSEACSWTFEACRGWTSCRPGSGSSAQLLAWFR